MEGGRGAAADGPAQHAAAGEIHQKIPPPTPSSAPISCPRGSSRTSSRKGSSTRIFPSWSPISTCMRCGCRAFSTATLSPSTRTRAHLEALGLPAERITVSENSDRSCFRRTHRPRGVCAGIRPRSRQDPRCSSPRGRSREPHGDRREPIDATETRHADDCHLWKERGDAAARAEHHGRGQSRVSKSSATATACMTLMKISDLFVGKPGGGSPPRNRSPADCRW